MAPFNGAKYKRTLSRMSRRKLLSVFIFCSELSCGYGVSPTLFRPSLLSALQQAPHKWLDIGILQSFAAVQQEYIPVKRSV